MSTATVLGGTVPYHFIPPSINSVFDLETNDTILGGAGSADYFLTGNTTLYATEGTGSSTVFSEDQLYFVGGGGNATVQAGSGNTTLFGGTGKTVLLGGSGATEAYAGTGHITVIGGSGDITFNGVASKNEEFITGTGTAAVTVGSGSNTILGGTGASTITAGTGTAAGHDVFSFVAGHGGGTETILNFNTSKDKIELSGYDTPPPVETLSGGSDVITLSDGTQITLVGVDHKVL